MKILVVCCSGTVLGPMFAELLRKALMARRIMGVEVVSVGVVESCRGEFADMGWRNIERDTLVSLADFQSQVLSDVDPKSFDEVICVDGSATADLLRVQGSFRFINLVNPALTRSNDSFRTSFFNMRWMVECYVDGHAGLQSLIAPLRSSISA